MRHSDRTFLRRHTKTYCWSCRITTRLLAQCLLLWKPKEERLIRYERLNILTRQILHYLIDHPDAKDTSTGIRDCWARHVQGISLADLYTVLEVLVTSGWLDKRERLSQHALYGFDEERLRKQVAALKALETLDRDARPFHLENERGGRPLLISEQEEIWHFEGKHKGDELRSDWS
jgi:hypothetical protein